MEHKTEGTESFQEDFTTVTEWEVFLARIEEIIIDWQKQSLTFNKSKDYTWTIVKERLLYSEIDFVLAYYRFNVPTNDEQLSNENLFVKSSNFMLYNWDLMQVPHSCIRQWYSVDEFIVLYTEKNVPIFDRGQIKMLLSSLHVASDNAKCSIPLFAQVHEPADHYYLGVYRDYESPIAIRTSLEMIYLDYIPQQCGHLNGLMDLFRTKIGLKVALSLKAPPTKIALQNTYTIKKFGQLLYQQDINACSLNKLPCGTTTDPLVELMVKAWFLGRDERFACDNISNTTFVPTEASKWSLQASFVDKPVCLLGDFLADFLVVPVNVTVGDALGDSTIFSHIISDENRPQKNPLNVLTEPVIPTITALINSIKIQHVFADLIGTSSKKSASANSNYPLNADTLTSLLYFLFPDAEKCVDAKHDYGFIEIFNSIKADGEDEVEEGSFDANYECKDIKGCPVDCLVWRLTIVLGHCLQSLGGVQAFAQLWYEFVQELRYRWENGISIPGLSRGAPDLRTCILYQKIQMLNCCINHKIDQMEQANSSNKTETHPVAEPSSSCASDDEDDENFFDCSETVTTETQIGEKKVFTHPIWNQPVGRCKPLEHQKLLKTGEQLYVPVTQGAVLKTEDQLEDDKNVLLELGTSTEGAELRTRLMSASLLSDMESFKAANPGSILEDFIRWYSPRDWIEKTADDAECDEWGQKRGELSSRMKLENNAWVEMWQIANPVPAHRQKRLFDDTREAEKVLHHLESLTLYEVALHLLPIACTCAIYRLSDELSTVHGIPSRRTIDQLKATIRSLERITKDSINLNSNDQNNLDMSRSLKSVIQDITAVEIFISQCKSLTVKLKANKVIEPDAQESPETVNQLNSILGELAHKNEVFIGKVQVDACLEQQLIHLWLLQQSENEKEKENAGTSVKDTNQQLPANPKFANLLTNVRPNQREFVLRTSLPRPSSRSKRCPHYMRAIVKRNYFRVAAAISEDLNSH